MILSIFLSRINRYNYYLSNQLLLSNQFYIKNYGLRKVKENKRDEIVKNFLQDCIRFIIIKILRLKFISSTS